MGGHLMENLGDIAEKYGKLTRVGPNIICCAEANEIRRIWSVHSGYQRSDWYKGYRIDPNTESILTEISNKEHHRIKTRLLPGYMGRGQGGQEKVVDDQVIKFLDLVNRVYISDHLTTRPMEMGKVFQFLTQDVTSAVEFGKPFGYLDDNADTKGVIAALESTQLPCAMMALLPGLLAIVTSPVFKPFMPKPTDKDGIGRLLGIVKAHVDERYGEKKKMNPDVIQSFIESGLSRQQVEAEALVHLLGGSDTTATAIRNAIFYVATNPRSYRRLQAEVDGAAASVTRPIITDAEAKKLLFLQATIKEALRMWPPIMGLMPKISAKDDVICGKEIPAGTFVAWCPMAIMKDQNIFGGNADVFEPMRWLESDATRLREMEATQGLVFMGGTRWECLGRKLAYVELGKVLFELFLRFDFSMINPAKPFQFVSHGSTIHENMKRLHAED
ncbi:hypothetical protein OQA88_1471 [Cercophora sp. LCS_1]